MPTTSPAPDTRPAHAGPRPPARRRRRWLPREHGAWAMLLVPFAAGLVAAGFRGPDLALLVAWVDGYVFSWFARQALRSRRPARYRPQLVLHGAVTATALATVLVTRPGVAVFAPVYAVLAGANAWYAWRRDERAVVNDLAAVLACCTVVGVVAAVAGEPPQEVWRPFVLCLAYFTGTVFYVKTMIRERGNPRYVRLSLAVHAVAWVAATAAGGLPALALFGWFALRAALLPGRGWPPRRVGFLELAHCLLLLGSVAIS